MTDNNHITEHRIYGGLMTVLEACGLQVLRDPTGNHHLVKGTLESAAAFYKLTVAGADASSTAANATGHVLAISAREKLRRAHDALVGMSDTDLDHFDNEEDEIEAVPDQYAARMIYAAIDDLDALLAYPGFSAPPAKNEGGA